MIIFERCNRLFITASYRQSHCRKSKISHNSVRCNQKTLNRQESVKDSNPTKSIWRLRWDESSPLAMTNLLQLQSRFFRLSEKTSACWGWRILHSTTQFPLSASLCCCTTCLANILKKDTCMGKYKGWVQARYLLEFLTSSSAQHTPPHSRRHPQRISNGD